LSEKQKQQNECCDGGTGCALKARVVPSSLVVYLALNCSRHGPCLYFCTKSSYFWPKSTPNLLSFAPRLNPSNICSWN